MSRLRTEVHSWPRAGGAERAPIGLRAVVVGGGIAGVAAATVLVERGVAVSILEGEAYLGGRAGAWTETLDGEGPFEMERGFHAFFRHYYNLRAWLRRIDPDLSLLQPVDDYPVVGDDGAVQSFKDLPTTPPFQFAAVARRTPYLKARDLLAVNKRAAMEMLAFDRERTYARFDGASARAYLDSLNFPDPARRMLFDVFSHSFFNPESEMSAAELLMMFHFYFAANPEGLVFDVAKQPFSVAIWRPFADWLTERGAAIATRTRAQRIERGPRGWRVHHDGGYVDGELVILALDVAGLQRLVAASPTLDDRRFRDQVARLTVTRPFAVWRLWLDRPMRADRAPFAGTVGLGVLDNISVYDKLEDESAVWARRNGGAVVELHGYALPPGLGEAEVKQQLLGGLHRLYPEARGARILHDRYLVKDDCPGFPPAADRARPSVETPFEGIALCGDLVRLPMPAALMEKAATSGFLAANAVLASRGIRPEPVCSVAQRGLFAPWSLPRPRQRRATNRPARAAPHIWTFGAPLPEVEATDARPDWAQASGRWIRNALARSQQLPSGGWYAVGASRRFKATPTGVRIADRPLVVWRAKGRLYAAPNACPHLGAPLNEGRVRDGHLVCPWHGLSLGPEGHGAWKPIASYDDGVLFWVRLDEPGQAPRALPYLSERPTHSIDSVMRVEARCEPRDVVQNRLDPWHGVHLHPHSFARLRVIDQDEDRVTVRVAFRVLGRACVEVDARFHCADPRTIVMTIVAGDGAGSVVETHATPIEPGRTAIIEATLATSDRPAFLLARWAGGAVRPLMERAARRLWVEDAAYAEQLYRQRAIRRS